jgi:predicted ArsR family transcriptional regulator
MTSNVEMLSSFFPEELKGAVKGFDHKIRQAVVAALLIKGDLSFTQLSGMLGISKGLLSHHLDILLDSAFIRNYSQLEFKGRFDSYYAISSLGEALIDSFARTFALRTQRLPASNQASSGFGAVVRKRLDVETPHQLPIAQAQTTSSIENRISP